MTNKIYAKIKNYIKENYWFWLGVILIITLFNYDTGYSIYKPGGVINMNNRITAEYKSEGSFNMAYVGYMRGILPLYLVGKFNPDWELVKNTSLKEDNESIDDANLRDHLYYLAAVQSAKIVAYKYSNTPYKITNLHFYVSTLTEENDSDLKVGDEILSYDNIKLTDFDEFCDYIRAKDASDKIIVEYLRDGDTKKTDVVLYEDEGVTYSGMSLIIVKDIDSDKEVSIKTKNSESGPSGGLIMALSLYNGLTKEDVTYGMKIVGTGTIDEDGNVGPIGGVPYKLGAAVKAKADLFICPSDNYEEAIEYAKEKKYNISIKKVDTFEEALSILKEEGEKHVTN